MKKMTGLQMGIIILVLAAAALHFGAAFDPELFPTGPDPLFTLNGLGYLGLLGAYFLPIPYLQQKHKLVRWLLLFYASLTIALWFIISIGLNAIVQGMSLISRDTVYGVSATLIEIVLVLLLWKDKP